jgi:hypothetical protein
MRLENERLQEEEQKKLEQQEKWNNGVSLKVSTSWDGEWPGDDAPLMSRVRWYAKIKGKRKFI